MEALRSGRIPIQRLEDAIRRRRSALARVSPGDESEGPLVTAADLALEEQLVESSLIRLSAREISPAAGLNLIRVDGVLPCPPLDSSAPAITQPLAHGFRPVLIHGQGVSPWQDQPESPLALERLGDGPVLLQLFLRGNPFRGDRDSREPWGAAVLQLQRLKRLAGLLIYGSPYLWEELQPLLNSTIPALYSPGQMPVAQRLALGQLLPESAAGFSADFTD